METLQQQTKKPGTTTSVTSTFRFMLIIGLVNCGSTAVDSMTNAIIPITLRHFIFDAFWISCIIATNRLFGFLVQPYIAWKGDIINTRFGRRRFFMLIGMPLTLITLLMIGAMPFLFSTDTLRHSTYVIALLVVLNVAMQFFQDVNAGTQDPLYADTFRHQDLGRAAGIRNYWQLIAGLSITFLGMKLVNIGEFFPSLKNSAFGNRIISLGEFLPYLLAAAWMLISITTVVRFVRERPNKTITRSRYNPLAHIGMLFKSIDYFRIATISAMWLVLMACFSLFQSLFVTRTLQLTLGDFGTMNLIGTAAAFLFSFPAGYLCDRLGPKPVLASGFFLLLFVSIWMSYGDIGYWALMTITIVYCISGVLMAIPMTPIVFQYASPTERGQVFGLIQFVRGFSAFVFSLVLGFMIARVPSYDSMPIYDEDLKQTHALAMAIESQKTPVDQYLFTHLPTDLRAQLNTASLEKITIPEQKEPQVNPAYKDFKKNLAAELTRIARQDLTYSPELFKNVQLRKQSQHFLATPPKNDQQKFVFNRSLIQDSYPDYIQAKQDYRVAYKICIVLSLFAAVLTLTVRKGKYASVETEEDAVYEM